MSASDGKVQKLGIFAGARESIKDLFRWSTRVTIVDEKGNEQIEYQPLQPPTNPFKLLASVTAKGWLFYGCGFLAWTADAVDFHALSISMNKVATYYGVTKGEVSTAITLTLLLRSVGAILFGITSDFYGRKYPMTLNMFLLGALQVGSIYAPDFKTFLAVRALFGIAMGGIWGSAVSMALEEIPAPSRGLLSGVLQQGYSFGYVLAACMNLGVGGSPEGFHTLFWVGAGLSFGVGALRLCFPESSQFVAAKKEGKKGASTGAFMKQFGSCVKTEWRRIIYCVVLMALFNFYSHTTQDTYTTMLLTTKSFDNSQASRASILMKTGACVGGTIIGWISQSFGRRRSIFVAALISCCLIPAWILPNSERGLSASGFMIQFFVQGAWGVIPVHLTELAPPLYRASFPGIAYQLGNAISSPSAQIVTEISERTFITNSLGERVEAFGPVMGIATAIIALGIAFWIAVGPERKGFNFEAVPVVVEESGPKPNDLEAQPDSSNDKRDSEEKLSFDDEKKGNNQVETLTKNA